MKYLRNTVFVLLFLPSMLRSQSAQTEKFQVYPPNAYALGRYGDIPVDYSTGVPNISVPLMSISDKDLTVDVSLSYHATGIKVDQEATWVGLGWVLNAGGIITRDIRGKPDNGQTRPIIEDFLPDYSNYNSSLDQYLNTVTPKIQQIASPSEDFYDGESDIYYYNFNGRTGKFFLDNNNNICLFKHDDIIIDKNTFTITDDTGIKYFFDKPVYIQQGAKVNITSWYLTKMISPTGGEINFEYENKINYYAVSRNHTACFINASTATGSLSINEASNHAGDVSSKYYIIEPLLSRITTKSGHYINLIAPMENRKDVESFSGRALKEISLYNNRNELQKGIELNYDYFEANTSRRYKNRENNEVSSLDYLNYRLRLESVKEFSKSKEYGYTYHFEYYGDNNPVTDDVYTLPYRLSPCQDHWGYYNGSYNKTIFPGNSNDSYPYIETDPWFTQIVSDYEPIDLSPQSHRIYGANREPDGEALKAGTLNKIIYPTGGYTQFDFEANRDGNIRGGLRIKQTETFDNHGNITKKKYSYSGIDDDLVYVNKSRNYYHTYLYNPILFNYNTGPGSEGDTYKFQLVRSALIYMGVPPELVYHENYNKFIPACACGTYLRVVKIDGSSPLRLGLEGETAYSNVIEEVEGFGKTEYNYTNCKSQYDDYSPVDYPETYNAFFTGSIQTLSSYWENKSFSGTGTNCFTLPYPSSIDYGWQSKLLNCKRFYDKEGKLIAEDSISYTTKLLHAVPNFKVIKLSDHYYTYTRSYNTGGMTNISKEINRQYTPDGRVVRSSNEYDYLSLYHNKVTEKRTGISQGDITTTKYYYPQDYGNYFSVLKSKNIIAPIDERRYRGNKLISGKQVKYNDYGQPIMTYNAESAGDITFNASAPFTFSPYQKYSYDAVSNNLQTLTVRDGIITSYLCGYGGQYPVAKIENATYAEVITALTQATIDNLNSSSQTEATMETLIKSAADKLRTNLPQAMVTSYTYKPLIGMTSKTDARGITEYYKYDGMQRLQAILDHLNNVNRSFDYHYRSN